MAAPISLDCSISSSSVITYIYTAHVVAVQQCEHVRRSNKRPHAVVRVACGVDLAKSKVMQVNVHVRTSNMCAYNNRKMRQVSKRACDVISYSHSEQYVLEDCAIALCLLFAELAGRGVGVLVTTR